MITPEQEKWIQHLSGRVISMYPYDPRSEELFQKIKRKIQDILGLDIEVEHVGASSLGISGQDEIDVSIVVDKEKFQEYVPKLEVVFGPVASDYPDRKRFEVREEGKKIDLKIVDRNHPNYLDGKKFEKYLRNHPESLGEYRILKEECSGKTNQEYYRKKIEFINSIIEKVSLEK